MPGHTPSEKEKKGKRTRKTVPKRLRKKVSKKISKLSHEGKPHDQAIAQGINQTLHEDKKRRRR